MKTLNPQKKRTIELNEVVLMKAAINYTIIHFRDGKSLTSSYTLKFHEKLLDSTAFVRVSKSYLLNRQYITGYSKTNNIIFAHLENGLSVQVSRRRQIAFFQ